MEGTSGAPCCWSIGLVALAASPEASSAAAATGPLARINSLPADAAAAADCHCCAAAASAIHRSPRHWLPAPPAPQHAARRCWRRALSSRSSLPSRRSCWRSATPQSYACRAVMSASRTEPAFLRLAARLLPKSRLLAWLPMRVPNWMARFTRAAARGRPSCRSATRSIILSPVPVNRLNEFLTVFCVYVFCDYVDEVRPAARGMPSCCSASHRTTLLPVPASRHDSDVNRKTVLTLLLAILLGCWQ